MASILRKGKAVVITSGYFAATFEIGKEDVVDLIDNPNKLTRFGHTGDGESTSNGKKVDLKEEVDIEDEPGQSQVLGKGGEESVTEGNDPMGSTESVTESLRNSELQYIISTDISQCGKYVAMVSTEKSLLVWNTNNWELLNVRNLARKPSRVRFTPISNEILVADKCGSLYSFPLLDDSSNGKLILAHLSMLLDIVVTPDERFVITSDRDEKIRVSYLTAPYNIQSFCQGHLEFVSNISLLPCHDSILVSGSGDGTIRFWNYYDGSELEALHCYTIIAESDCERESLAVKSFSLENINDKAVLCVCLSEFPGTLVYEIEIQNMQVDIKFIQKITLRAEPLCLIIDSFSIIWCVIQTGRQSVEVQCQGLRTSVSDDIRLTLDKINEKRDFLLESLYVPSLIPMLFKKKYETQGGDRELLDSPTRNGPPPKKAKQSCDKQGTT